MNWSFGKYGWRVLPGSIMALIIAILLKLGAIQPLEQSAYRTLFRLRGEMGCDGRLVLISIDDASLKQLGRFPWSRQQYAKLLDVLSEADASVVAFDLLWSEPSAADSQLAQAMTKQGRVVLAEGWDSTGLPLQPVPTLEAVAIAHGHILQREDSDGVTRKVSLQIQEEPELSVAAVQAYGLVQAPVPLPALDQPLWVNWLGPVQQFPQYSFADVIRHKVPAQVFRNKIVLVGVTASGIDPMVTPFNNNPPANGVHLQATVISNLLQQNPLHPVSDYWELIILLLGGPGVSWLLSFWKTEYQFLAWIGLVVGWGAFSLLLFKLSYWFPVALPLSLFTCTTVAVAGADKLRLNALLQHQVQQLWQAYQHDIVLLPGSDIEPTIKLSHQSSPSMRSAVQLAALAVQFRRSQLTQTAIARSVSIGLLAADWDGFVWFCNPVAAKSLQLQAGNNLNSSLIPEYFSLEEWQTALQTLKQYNQVPPKEVLQAGHWIELRLELLDYQPQQADAVTFVNRLNGLLLLLEDVTARKQVEENLNRQMQELEQINTLKDDFLSTVSHELRAPLTNMKMAIHLLKVAHLEEQRNHYLQILQDECRREVDLINDLLDLQRLETGHQNWRAEKIYLSDWLPIIVKPFYERAESRQQALELQLAPELPNLVSERSSLERLLVELINNACKYTPPSGEIKVLADFTPPHIEFTVTNSGAEIPEAELPRIFEKFYRVPQADPWKQGGTGLGLALVKKIVERLGGTIRVKSGSGWTTFTVQLPEKREAQRFF